MTTPPPPPPTPPPVTQPPAPTTLTDLSATVTSPQANASINCRDDVRARITLTNRGGTPVTVTAVLDTTGIPSGDCFGDGDRTFRYSTPPTVLQESFQVITNVGNVPAGLFNYKIFFQNCRSCPGSVAAAAGGTACANSPR